MEQLQELLAGTNFTALDWAIVAAYVLATVFVGLIARKFISGMDDFVVAGRGLKTALGVATITGTELGLVTVMYSAEKGFTGGFAAFHIGLIAGIVTFLVGFSGFIVAGLRRQKVLTIPEFYGKRFGTRTRVLGGIMLSFGGILNMGMFLKAGAMFVVGITGLSVDYEWLVMLVLLSFVLFYTVLGGMVSVILMDYINFVILSFGLLAATALSIHHIGWNNVFETVAEFKGEAGFNPLVEGAFGPDYVLWMVFGGLVSCALWPTAVARALAAESEQVVRKQYMWASLSYAIRNIVPYFWGICAFVFIMQTPALEQAFFPKGEEAEAVSSLYAMPVFMGRILPMGVIAFITAAMIAAFMSTHDSYLLCWSSVLTNDVIMPICGGKLSQKAQVLTTRICVVLVAAVIYFVSFVYVLEQDLWDYMMVTGAIYFTGAFALLVAGLYWRRASSTGAVLALLAGCFAVTGLDPVQKPYLMWRLGMSAKEVVVHMQGRDVSAVIGLSTVALAVTAMVAGSLLFPDKERPSTQGDTP